MARDYPNAPSEGTLSIPTNPTGGAPIYRYTSGKWVKNGGGSATAQKSNRLQNVGLFANTLSPNLIDTTATNTNFYAGADGWVIGATGAGVVRVQKVEVWTPRGNKYRMRLTVNTADTSLTSTDWYYLGGKADFHEPNAYTDFQYGTASAKYSVLRFGFKAPAGTYSVSIRNDALAMSFVSPFTVAAGVANTDQEYVIIVPPCTTGTWNGGTSATTRFFLLYFTIASASTTATVNSWTAANATTASTNTNGMATVGNVFEVFDLGWYLDPLTTGVPPDLQVGYLEDDIKDSLRYSAKVLGGVGVATAATTVLRMVVTPPVPLAKVPTLIHDATMQLWNGNSPNLNVTSLGTTGSMNGTLCMDFSPVASAGTMTLGNAEFACSLSGMTDYNYTPMWNGDAR